LVNIIMSIDAISLNVCSLMIYSAAKNKLTLDSIITHVQNNLIGGFLISILYLKYTNQYNYYTPQVKYGSEATGHDSFFTRHTSTLLS